MIRASLRRATLCASRRLFSSSAAPSGQLYVCGTGDSHKLGLGDTNDREAPVPLELGAPVVHAACGKYHSAAVTADGEVYMWGLESSGQLGLGSSRTKARTPQRVEALSGVGVVEVSCGMYHTLARTEGGDVYSCGFGGSFLNGVGGLGHDSRAQLDAPQRIEGLGEAAGAKVVSVSAGGFHSVALDDQRRVWTWGRGEWGRLGHGDSSDAYVPTHLESVTDDGLQPTAAVAAEQHSAVVGGAGELLTWGRNEHFQLGYEVVGLLNSGQSFDAQDAPLRVDFADGAPVASVGVGETSTIALMADGDVWLWGMRRYYEPTRLSVGRELLDGLTIANVQCGGSHATLLTTCGRCFTYGKGTALGLSKAERKSWELTEVSSFVGRKVLSVACGEYNTAFIVEA